MTWTTTSEQVARCNGKFGRVQCKESVARHVHSKNCPPERDEFEPIRRSELFPKKLEKVDNSCGNSDGISVDRIIELSDQELFKRGLDRVFGKEDRQALGFLKACVHDLRRIRLDDAPNTQCVYVYDDPKPPNNEQHGVIRGCQDVPKTRQDEVREEIKEKFSELVSIEGQSEEFK
jgi:hypothetical protein